MKKKNALVEEAIEEATLDTETAEAIAGIVANGEEADAVDADNGINSTEGIIAVLDLPISMPDKKAYDFLEAGIAYGNIIIPEFHFVGDNNVLLRLEIRRVNY